MALQHLRSSTANKRPLPAGMSDGQLAINTNTASPGLFFKDSGGNLVKAGPVHIGTTAPNASPASGGATGNSTGELWLDTSLTPSELKTWDGSAWVSATGQEIPVSKLIDGSARQLLQTDAAGTGVEWTSNVDVPGTLDVTSTATFDSIASHPLGSAGAPTITFTGDTNTGIYSPGADQVAISTNGTGRLFVDSSGRVGVGVSNPTGNLVVSNGGAQGLEIFHSSTDSAPSFLSYNRSGAAYTQLGFDALNYRFKIAGTNAVEVTSAGRVGIGTTAPGFLLDVRPTGVGQARVGSQDNQAGFSLSSGNATNPFFSFLSNTSTLEAQIYGVAGSAALAFATGSSATERMRLTSTGLGIGTSSPSADLHISRSSGSAVSSISVSAGASNFARLQLNQSPSNSWQFYTGGDTNKLGIGRDGVAEYLTIDSSGRVGIGTTSPSETLHVAGTFRANTSNIYTQAGGNSLTIYSHVDNTSRIRLLNNAGSAEFAALDTDGTNSTIRSSGALIVSTNNSERARIDSSGRLLVGTSTSRTVGRLVGTGNFPNQYPEQIEGANAFAGLSLITNRSSDETGSVVTLGKTRSASLGGVTIVNNGDDLGAICFAGADGTDIESLGGAISCQVDGTPGANNMPGRIVLSTTASGASSPTERMRITSGGSVFIGKTSGAGQGNVLGIDLGTNQGQALFVTGSTSILYLNRNTDDGDLVRFAQGGTDEGTISVSGTTVSYNGAHLSRWSQLPSGAERIEILRGSVLSNIDEMCEWGEEDNEQLNRMKVSDVEGDKNVSGVFQAWDDDDDTYTNDFYCAMTGDFIIRIGAGVTVERGDLLMSAGDGTAKPQDDDIIRSKTIAKVTSTNVSCTYDDGSYCVPCVLMAC